VPVAAGAFFDTVAGFLPTMSEMRIIYTLTDEAPALATYSLLPIVKAFAGAAGVRVETRDISLAARILAAFPDRLEEHQRVADDLAELGEMVGQPDANIIKLPNISASIPQLQAAISELQSQGFAVPGYPEDPQNDEEKDIKKRYSRVLGSAVNPVLREGNSDRRVAAPVKQHARLHPHAMGEWSTRSRSHVAHMEAGDFYGSEQSVDISADGELTIELHLPDGSSQVLKQAVKVQGGDIVDSAVMSRWALREFFAREIEDARREDLLLSLHLKATMMKVSDPIMFGHAVEVYFADVFERHREALAQYQVDPNNGIGDLYDTLPDMPDELRAQIEADLKEVYARRPALAMVDSDRGITNLHVPSDVIIDASMPAAVRSSGQMWGPDGKLRDTKALIPDRCYAGIYQAVFDDCRSRGAFDPVTMGNVSNVGLMAQKAEEYGSHDKTFEIPADGVVRVRNEGGVVLMEHKVEQGDIWRMCQTHDLPVRDWVKLAVSRARATGAATLFWLDPRRAHDLRVAEKVKRYLGHHDTRGLDIRTLAPVDAMRETLAGVRAGRDFVSVTGNVLRDYLTDLFPILELGTSAKMLSIVPLLNGGGLYETGAGGSAPKHVQQFLAHNHLRWDSLGEFLALQVSLEDLGEKNSNPQAMLLAKALNEANAFFLEKNKSPSRKVGEMGTRGSHYYLGLFWARAVARQHEDTQLAERFGPIAARLNDDKQKILGELNAVQGQAVDIGGYYRPDPEKVSARMRPSATLNSILDLLEA
jgi:isocitrate dehydrogenase